MKKNRWIFYAVFGLFHLAAFIFTVVLQGNTGLLLKMAGWIPYFKWITLLGLILLIVDIIWAISDQKAHQKERAALSHELNTLKAKLFDLQEASRNSPAPTNPGKPKP
jgi:hypothetical protein